MQDISKEFRNFIGDNEEPKNLHGERVYIIKSKSMPTIGADGNITVKETNTCYLQLSTNVPNDKYRISKEYYGLQHIRDDFFTVLNFDVADSSVDSQSLFENRQAYPKFGIIKLERDCSYRTGFKPQKEKIIAPIIYDRIYVYDEKFPIVEVNNHYTYFCIDENSQNYGKQLLPVVLESACPFNIKYAGFAECVIEGETRFIPIDFIATEKITKDDLLTEEEVISLINSYEAFRKMNQIGKTTMPRLIKSLKKN